MIKKLTITILTLACFLTITAQRTGKMTIQGNLCEYDTLVHRHIAPGAILTQYQFNNIAIDNQTYKMKAHVISIDMTNKYNYFTPYLSKDSYYSINTQKKEVALRKTKGLKPIATITGGGFVQSNDDHTTNSSYEVSGSLVTKGQIKYQKRSASLNIYTDGNRIVHIAKTKMSGTVSANGSSFTIAQVNHYRDKADANEQISLFCNGVPKSVASTAKIDKGTDVRVELVGDTLINSGKEIKCKVIEILSGCNHSVGKNEAILSGIGAAETYLKTLSVGDEVSIKIDYVDSNNNILDVQDQLTNLFGYCIKDGEVQEYSRKNYAICAIGTSEDGKTTYWADLEISANSNAPCICLADLLKEVGVYNAMWLDGGPSAEMTVDGDFITTNSIGYGFNGRYIPAGFVLYSEAPTDMTISTIELLDPTAKTVYSGGTISPKVYAYNQYGEMISNNAAAAKGITITCTEGLGTIANGVFTAAKTGSGYLTIKVQSTGYTVNIPITVISKRELVVYPKELFTGEFRSCQAMLSLKENGVTIPINPENAKWTHTGAMTIKSCENGLIEPNADGQAYVYATYDNLSDTIIVTVENLVEVVDSIDYSPLIFDTTYPDIKFRSVPHYFTAAITGEPNTDASLYYTTGKVTNTVQCHIPESGVANIRVELDYDAVDTYPVSVDYVTGTARDGVDYQVTELISYYKVYTGIKNLTMSDCKLTIVNDAGKLAIRNESDTYASGILRIFMTNGAICGEYKFSVPSHGQNDICTYPSYPFATKISVIK